MIFRWFFKKYTPSQQSTHRLSMANVLTHSLISDIDIELFRSGKHFKLYEKLGSHIIKKDGKEGVFFAVWAPNAESVAVMGNFNHWNPQEYMLYPRWDGSGIWEGFIAGVKHGDLYKYSIQSRNGRWLEKGDPFAHFWEIPPNTASIVWGIDDYKWKDKKWLNKRKKNIGEPKPYSVYEVHAGSWRKLDGGTRSLSYREMADEMVTYVKEMGFTHVEFMPVMEHPYFPSWGYQITGYYAPTSRFGTPQDFMYLVDAFHQADIGVLLDWVPSHFPEDAHGLADFDGTHLFDHADPRLGFHPDWKSCIFNYGRMEVRSFLISNAIFWLDKYHADGLRVDAVASMLYLDYSRDDGQWIPNIYGGNENLDAVAFLKEFNETVYREFPDAVTIAEESTSWPGVSRPTYTGGLGFGQKWMMGWMHDSLKYFKRDPIYRRFHHSEISFSLVYAFSENFMLPLSHDEVVHGKGSIISRMPGDEWQRFANLRALYGKMFMHPGTQLLYMGDEWGQQPEWSLEKGLDWGALDSPYNQGVLKLVKDLNQLYSSKKALYEQQFEQAGFQWISHDDSKNSVIAFLRKGKQKEDTLLVVCHLANHAISNYKIGVPNFLNWKEILNTDDLKYGGSGMHHSGTIKAEHMPMHGLPLSVTLTLSPLAVMVFEAVV